MRIQTDCCCGATFTLDDGGQDNTYIRSQFDARHAAWNALHKDCPSLLVANGVALDRRPEENNL